MRILRQNANKIANTSLIKTKDIRSIVLQLLILGAFLIVTFRLLQIQIFNSDKYRAMARDQQMKVTNIVAKRGGIYTSDGYPLATTATNYYLNIDQTKITSLEEALKGISSIVKLDIKEITDTFTFTNKEKLSENTNKRSKPFHRFIFSKKISYDQKLALEKLNTPGIVITSKTERYYPENTMLSHVLGIVGQKEDGEPVGYFGLEQFYNGDLEGQNGADMQVKSASGSPILQAAYDKIPSKNGSDIYLTINRDIQFIISEGLKSGVQKYKAKTGTVVVVNPKTGEIIALSNYPDFNPSAEVDNLESLANFAISRVYEPGSIMKPITVAAGLETKKINRDSTYNDTAPKYYSGHKIDNWDGKHHGIESIASTLAHSNNMATAWFGLQLGAENLTEYFQKFGFGSRTGIDLEGEESGIFEGNSENHKLREIEIANNSFGQGIAVTPLQMVMAYSVIANGGYLMRPYIVESIIAGGVKHKIEPQVVRQVISKQNSDLMVDFLNLAVNNGEAKFFVSKRYNISGKTGTAQIAIHGGYDKHKTNASFIGFFTKYKDFVMLVKLEEPTFPSGFAAETAVPLWMSLAHKIAGYYGFAPDRVLVTK